jgi:hypothetical protein
LKFDIIKVKEVFSARVTLFLKTRVLNRPHDIQHNDIQNNPNHQDDTQHYDIVDNGLNCDIQLNNFLTLHTLMAIAIMPNVNMHNVVLL